MFLSKNVEGDGKSKATALFLTTSEHRRDHISFQYIWLARKGLKSLKQMIRPGEDGFMYDIHITEKGSVWFKTPALKISLSINSLNRVSA